MPTDRPRLREARAEAGLTQVKLADLIGAQQSNVARYESGAQMPRVDTALRMALVLGTTVEAIWAPKSFGRKAEEEGNGAGGHPTGDTHSPNAAGPDPDPIKSPRAAATAGGVTTHGGPHEQRAPQ